MNTETLLLEIADRDMTRDDVASTYGLALVGGGVVDWARVNRAIIGRWSLSGLQYIKRVAWRRAERRPKR